MHPIAFMKSVTMILAINITLKRTGRNVDAILNTNHGCNHNPGVAAPLRYGHRDSVGGRWNFGDGDYDGSRSWIKTMGLKGPEKMAETFWLWNILRELQSPLHSATIIYCDNVRAVYISFNLVQPQRTKHIEIDIHFVRDQVATGHVRVLHVLSRYQYANIFTKGLPSALFHELRTNLSVLRFPAPTSRGS
ncbi:ribonuclease H-like domain-containing protein [Tanacetum coccineum]